MRKRRKCEKESSRHPTRVKALHPSRDRTNMSAGQDRFYQPLSRTEPDGESDRRRQLGCALIGMAAPPFAGVYMSTITTTDGVEIFYKDWGSGQPIVFSHGWPLSADDWDNQMLFFLGKGYRVIAHDRRGHGRSTQVADGHDMDHYADDLAALTAHLGLKDAIHVGHSTGGGEVVHYLARRGQQDVSKAAIISAVPPLMVKTAANPEGLPK